MAKASNKINKEPFLVYKATLFGSTSGAPTPTIMQNTLGQDVVITNPTTGTYFFAFDTPDQFKILVHPIPAMEKVRYNLGVSVNGVDVNFIDETDNPANISFLNTPIIIEIHP